MITAKLAALVAALLAALGPWTHAEASHHRPSGLIGGRVHRYTDCHGKGVIVWEKGSDPEVNGTSALHCKDGKVFGS